MPNSDDIALLYRVAELARRFGLRPSEASGSFGLVEDGPDDHCGQFVLSFSSVPANSEKAEKFHKMMAALGCEGCQVRTDGMDEMEDIVERAFSLAPRSRSL